MIGMLIAGTIALALYASCRAGALRNDLRESEQIRDALVSAVHDCRAEIARLRLTDAERAFLELHAERLTSWQRASPESRAERVTVMGMLDRLGLPQNTQDQEHRMTDETTPQDDAAMPPASAGSTLWVISRAWPFSAVTVDGVDVKVYPGQPTRFMPLFETREQAVEWYGKDDENIHPLKVG